MKQIIVWGQHLRRHINTTTDSDCTFIVEDDSHNYYHLYIHWDKDSINRCIADQALAIKDSKLVLHPTDCQLSGYTLTLLTKEQLAAQFIRSK